MCREVRPVRSLPTPRHPPHRPLPPEAVLRSHLTFLPLPFRSHHNRTSRPRTPYVLGRAPPLICNGQRLRDAVCPAITGYLFTKTEHCLRTPLPSVSALMHFPAPAMLC